MKKVFALLMVIASFAMVCSCEKETILTVNQASLSFNNGGGSQTVNIVANKVWSASSNQSWCKVSPSSGDGSDNSNITLSVSCDANTTYDARTCTITITCEELTKTISVSQAEGKGLVLSQTEYNLTNDAQTISVEVQANVQYTVEIDNACKSWIKQESTKALSSNTIKFAISKNEDYDGREGKIIIKQTDGSLSGTVVVKQSQQNGLFVSTPEYFLSNEKHTLTIEVKANVEFDVKPNVAWIKHVETKGLKTSQIVLEVAANEAYDEREGVAVVKQKGGGLEGVITIKQEQNYGILVSQSEYSIPNEAQTIDVEVKYNVDYDVVIPDECKAWIKQVSTKGLNSKTYTFSIAKNETYDNREGSITFKQKKGSLSGTVAIKQSQTDGLFAEKTEYEVSFEEQQLNIKVKSNVGYDVQIDDSCKDWIRQIQTKGLVESLIILQITQNKGGETRHGKLAISNNAVKETITITQKAEGYIEFDDANFKAYCVENFDKNGDGEISMSEALNIRKINVSTTDIKSLQGIEFMPNLYFLLCRGKSEKIRGKLTSLDVSKNTALQELYCDYNRLTSLDLSKNTALQFLDCNTNQLITSLDMSKNEALQYLYCDNNQLTSLDVSKNTALQTLRCSINQLTSLDLSKNTALQFLDCWNNQLTSLDVSKNTALLELSCAYNRLTSLDVSKNTALQILWCEYNQLTSLDVSKNTALQELSCSNNQLTSLDVSKNTALQTLSCKDIQLTSLDVSNNESLLGLNCWNNQLTSLDVSKNIALQWLNCNNNKLTSLDVSKNTELEELYCSNNQLTSLDVSNNAFLNYLNCVDNPYLTEIWLKTGQVIWSFRYDTEVAIIKYK